MLQKWFCPDPLPKVPGRASAGLLLPDAQLLSECQAKRAALVAERLSTEILTPVPHRHLIFTIPKVLRGLFQRERRLLSILTRSAYDAVRQR